MIKRRYWFTPIVLDVLGYTLAFLLSCQILPMLEKAFATAYQSPGFIELAPILGVCLVILIPVLFLFDVYAIPKHWSGLRILRAIAMAHVLVVVCYITLTLFSATFIPARKAVVVSAAISTLFLWYGRLLYPELYGRVDRKRRALVVGAHTFALRALQRFARDHADEFEIIGVIDDFRSGQYFDNLGIEHCGTSKNLRTVFKTRPVDTLIVLMDQSQYADRIIELLDDYPTIKEIYVRAQVPLVVAQDIDLLFVQEVPLLKVYTSDQNPISHWLRFALDRVTAAAGFLALSPIFLIMPIIIKLDSRGPVFYRQLRLGQRNKPFWIYKFRSMVVDAEAKSGAVLAQKNDPRVTRVGRIMRMLRIDEVPQILNVLRGDMSIIGPRPERPEFQNIYRETIPWYSLRTLHKPGITGLAQVTGDYHTSTQRKLLYDVTYLANMGVFLDMRIMAATVLTVLTKRGH